MIRHVHVQTLVVRPSLFSSSNVEEVHRFLVTTYLVKEKGESLVVTNYVKGTIQASGDLQLSFSGYTEDVVNEGLRSSLFTLGERRESRVPLLSEIGESAVDHLYDRQHVSGSGTFSPG